MTQNYAKRAHPRVHIDQKWKLIMNGIDSVVENRFATVWASITPASTMQQHWYDHCDTSLIDNNGVYQNEIATPICSDSTVFNESSITSVTPKLSVNEPLGVIYIYDVVHLITTWTFNIFVRRTLHSDRTFPVTCPIPFLY